MTELSILIGIVHSCFKELELRTASITLIQSFTSDDKVDVHSDNVSPDAATMLLQMECDHYMTSYISYNIYIIRYSNRVPAL